jgi:trans-aconitate methyltransferase
MDKTAIEEYDAYYTKNPNLWADLPRDLFAFRTINEYLGSPPKTFLDIGCGNGHTVEVFSERWPSTECWGLDLSPVAIELAKRRVPKATFVCSSIEDATPRKFDVVVALGVLEHIEDHDTMFERLHAFVGNILYVEVPNCIAYKSSEKIEGFRRINQGNRQVEWHLYRESWEQRIVNAGFRIVKSIVGPSIYAEFVWILQRPPYIIGGKE